MDNSELLEILDGGWDAVEWEPDPSKVIADAAFAIRSLELELSAEREKSRRALAAVHGTREGAMLAAEAEIRRLKYTLAKKGEAK